MNGASRVETSSPPIVTVVLVGMARQDQAFLRDLFDCPARPPASDCLWAIEATASVQATLRVLRQDRIPVVLCDRDLMLEAWKELLDRFARLSAPPCLIVTSRLADERLWAEALNLGAYDVLARPFDGAEVVRTVNLARLHWQNNFTTHPRAVMRSFA